MITKLEKIKQTPQKTSWQRKVTAVAIVVDRDTDRHARPHTCRVEVRPSLSVCVSRAVLNDFPDMMLMISLYSRWLSSCPHSRPPPSPCWHLHPPAHSSLGGHRGREVATEVGISKRIRLYIIERARLPLQLFSKATENINRVFMGDFCDSPV